MTRHAFVDETDRPRTCVVRPSGHARSSERFEHISRPDARHDSRQRVRETLSDGPPDLLSIHRSDPRSGAGGTHCLLCKQEASVYC